jgi:hypothetical protein
MKTLSHDNLRWVSARVATYHKKGTLITSHIGLKCFTIPTCPTVALISRMHVVNLCSYAQGTRYVQYNYTRRDQQAHHNSGFAM